MFSLDFSELDKQENHDLRAQIQQNENWADWGLMMVQEVYESFMISVIGIFSGIALTITLFSSPVPNDSGWLATLNNPLFILFFAVIMIGVSILAGKLSAIATKCGATTLKKLPLEIVCLGISDSLEWIRNVA